MSPTSFGNLIAAIAAVAMTCPAFAQRAAENAVTSATDGFGATVGNERVGVYSTTSVRGFNPVTAGNRRLDGLYFDLGGNGLTNRLYRSNTIRVGLPAIAYPFPAPSGIVDYTLRKAGKDAVLSAVAGMPVYGGYSLELDGQMPLATDRLVFAGGVGLSSNTYVDGRHTRALSAAIMPTLLLGNDELTGFVGYSRTGGDVPPILITTGAQLPPSFDSGRFYNQRWIDNAQASKTYGLLGRFAIADRLVLRFGAFESRSVRQRTFSDLYLNVRPDGTAQNVVVADPRLPARWTSGEARISWDLGTSDVTQSLILSVRARDKHIVSGGSSQAALGAVRLGTLTPAAEPAFVFGVPSENDVRQLSAGLAYLAHWKAFDLNLGVQKTDYQSNLRRGARDDRTSATPWLYNAAIAYAPTAWLGFYGGVTHGLEESAAAPASTANRDDAVPASRTQQYDLGVRLVLGKLRVVAGAFQLERPYYSVGTGNIYRQLGETRNRGFELSVTGSLTDRLSIVGGLVLMDPRVTGEAFDAGRVGRRPVGSTTRSARLDLEYALPSVAGLSLTSGLQHSGAVTASTGNYAELGGRQLEVPPVTTFDVGARYRFKLAGTPVTARAQLFNVFGTLRPTVASSNAFMLPDTRRFSLQIAADL